MQVRNTIVQTSYTQALAVLPTTFIFELRREILSTRKILERRKTLMM